MFVNVNVKVIPIHLIVFILILIAVHQVSFVLLVNLIVMIMENIYQSVFLSTNVNPHYQVVF